MDKNEIEAKIKEIEIRLLTDKSLTPDEYASLHHEAIQLRLKLQGKS